MTEAALAGDRRIGMVAALPERIASMRENPATFSIGCAEAIENYRLLPDRRCNIVLLGIGRPRIKCKRPSTATRLYRIVELERLKKADDPEDSPEFALQRAHVVALFGDAMSRLGCVDCPAPDAFDESENDVLINSIASGSNFTTQERQGLLRKWGLRELRTALPFILRFAFAEPEAARTPPSGSLHGFIDVIKKLRNFKNKSKILRFFEIRSDSISAREALQRGAKKPEGRLRSAWNEIAIPVANSGFPSVSRRFSSTLIGVDKGAAIGVTWDCENR